MTDESHQPDESLLAEYADADEAVVTFHPQIWHGNRALTGDDIETYRVPIEAALGDNGKLLEDDSRESDGLADHENPSKRAQNWSKNDPFYVTIDELR